MRFASIVALCLTICATGSAAQDARRITVVGQGSSLAAPTIAVVQLGVEARGDSAQAALDDMSEALSAVIDGVAGDATQVQTSSVNLRQDYDGGSSLSGGRQTFVASSIVTLRSTDIDGLGEMLDAAVTAGANRIDSVSFSVADPAAALDEARQAAIIDAAAKAELFADAAGVTLGDLITLREVSGQGFPTGNTFATRSVPIVAGDVPISVQVEMVYAIN